MKLKRVIALLFFVILVAIGSAFSVKANIGVGAWDAIPKLVYEITGIKVGTIGMALNISCVFIQIVLLKKKFKTIQLLQIPVSIVAGFIINFILYDVLSLFTIEGNYILQLIFFLLGVTICAIFVGSIMVLDIITFALEATCMALSQFTKKEFSFMRQLADIICIVIALSGCFALGITPVIREATVIGMIVFSPIMGVSMKIQRPIFKKLGLID